MAEAVFTHMVKQCQLWERFDMIDSAGTAGLCVSQLKTHEKPDARCILTCEKYGVPIHHRARQLKEMCPEGSKAIIQLFGQYDPTGGPVIQDPYFGKNDEFDDAFHRITRSSKGFLTALGMM
ncbi:hypothetical protein EC973_002880 [Apophysomyces ossiformis]|uniref:protein-tyrosine-phosphatase n=1 Tax=Apophysomyces ossiformis TaxID=679940 RepID=A0A8H7EML8_9FUNG|nr:hypothetical protein EC973_002880 [Apophysomyces ossiformis]